MKANNLFVAMKIYQLSQTLQILQLHFIEFVLKKNMNVFFLLSNQLREIKMRHTPKIYLVLILVYFVINKPVEQCVNHFLNHE